MFTDVIMCMHVWFIMASYWPGLCTTVLGWSLWQISTSVRLQGELFYNVFLEHAVNRA